MIFTNHLNFYSNLFSAVFIYFVFLYQKSTKQLNAKVQVLKICVSNVLPV